MPPTREQARRQVAALTERHRTGQVQIGARTARTVLSSWLATVSPTALRLTSERWLTTALDTVRGSRRQSRRLSQDYYNLTRALVEGDALPPPGGAAGDTVTVRELEERFYGHLGEAAPASEWDDEQVKVDVDWDWPEEDAEVADGQARTSLVVTGPVHAQQLLDSLGELGRLDDPQWLAQLDDLMDTAGATAAAAADREALRGGRDALWSTGQRDRAVVGWARVTDRDPCAWCAMLASRGAVYRSATLASTAGSGRRRTPPVDLEDLTRYHDQCHCTVVPIYSRTEWVPPQSAQYRQDWYRVTRGLAGADARRAWARHIAAQRRERRAA